MRFLNRRGFGLGGLLDEVFTEKEKSVLWGVGGFLV